MRVLDLFSGIGGFSLGLQRAGMQPVAFCEIDPYCCAVLAKHWPGVPNLGDIRRVGVDQVAALEPINVLCGGFPCQDISRAGRGVGLAGERSGLWSEFARLIRLFRPDYVIVENVAMLLARGLAEILGQLASIGYDAQWHCIPAAHVGAPHRRDRIWIIAYPNSDTLRLDQQRSAGRRVDLQDGGNAEFGNDGAAQPLAHAHGGRCEVERLTQHARLQSPSRYQPDGCGAGRWGHGTQGTLADTARNVCAQQTSGGTEWHRTGQGGQSDPVPDAERERLERIEQARSATPPTDRPGRGRYSGWWESEPDVGRVAHGIPARVDRLRGLGNALVPQIAEIIGHALMQHATFQSPDNPAAPVFTVQPSTQG